MSNLEKVFIFAQRLPPICPSGRCMHRIRSKACALYSKLLRGECFSTNKGRCHGVEPYRLKQGYTKPGPLKLQTKDGTITQSSQQLQKSIIRRMSLLIQSVGFQIFLYPSNALLNPLFCGNYHRGLQNSSPNPLSFLPALISRYSRNSTSYQACLLNPILILILVSGI